MAASVVAPAAAAAATAAEAIVYALGHNRELRAPDAHLDGADATVEVARSARLPRVDVAGVYQRTDNPVLVFSNLLGQADFGEENFALDALNTPDPLDNWKTRLTVTQPLWTAGRIGHGVAAAERLGDAAASRREATRQRVIHGVIEAYTAAFLAERELAVTREALKTAEAHVRLVRDLHRGGLVVESDVLQAEVRESEVRELVIRAESGVEIARDTLALALGRDPSEPVTLPDEPDLEAGEVGRYEGSPEVAELVADALEGRPDLAAARLETAAAGERVALERAQKLPELGLEGAWEANARDFFGADGDNWAVTVALRVPVFDGFRRRAEVRRAEADRRRAEERTALHADGIALEVRRAVSELAAARQRLEQGKRGVSLAERSVEIVEDRYREGLTTLTELLDAETALTRARLRRLAARRDLFLARASLDLATGRL